jgi:hypothetical protein
LGYASRIDWWRNHLCHQEKGRCRWCVSSGFGIEFYLPMTSRDFCYWLQGYFEIANAHALTDALSVKQVEMIKRHLALVFKHEIDPSIPDPKGILQAIHDGTGFPHTDGAPTKPEVLYRC